MNSSEQEWTGVPEVYEVEIKASRKLHDVDLIANDTSNNETLTFRGKLWESNIIFMMNYELS